MRHFKLSFLVLFVFATGCQMIGEVLTVSPAAGSYELVEWGSRGLPQSASPARAICGAWGQDYLMDTLYAGTLSLSRSGNFSVTLDFWGRRAAMDSTLHVVPVGEPLRTTCNSDSGVWRVNGDMLEMSFFGFFGATPPPWMPTGLNASAITSGSMLYWNGSSYRRN